MLALNPLAYTSFAQDGRDHSSGAIFPLIMFFALGARILPCFYVKPTQQMHV
jgi:hypothetical protein